MKALITFILLSIVSCSGGHSIAGTWRGTLDIQGNDIPIVIYIKDLGDNKYEAKFDNPAQNVYGQKFDDITYKDGQLTLSSSMYDASYAGYLSKDKQKFEGELIFQGQQIPMTIVLDKKKK